MNRHRNVTFSAILAVGALVAVGYGSSRDWSPGRPVSASANVFDLSASTQIQRTVLTQSSEADLTLEALWRERIQPNKEVLLKEWKLRYLDGVPAVPVPKDLTSAHISIAQALYYLDSRYGVIAPRHRLRAPTDKEFSEHVDTLESKLRARGTPYSKEAIAAGLILLDEEQETRYSHFLRNASASSSETGYLGYLVRETLPKGKPLSVDDLREGINKLAKSYFHQVEVQLKSLTFDVLSKSLNDGQVVVMVGASDETWSTAVGYFIDNGRRYILVHEPRYAAARDSNGDFVPSLQSTSVQPGVKAYSFDRLPYKAAVAMGRPTIEIQLFSEFLKKHSSPKPNAGA
jgi:hypothetical protein